MEPSLETYKKPKSKVGIISKEIMARHFQKEDVTDVKVKLNSTDISLAVPGGKVNSDLLEWHTKLKRKNRQFSRDIK